MTFDRACTQNGKTCAPVCLQHIDTYKDTHFTEAMWERMCRAWGCCVSIVCSLCVIIPVHVRILYRPHSPLTLFTLTAMDSGLLSRRTERARKGWKGSGIKKAQIEGDRKGIIGSIFFPLLYLLQTTFSLLSGSSLILLSSKPLPPWVSSWQTARAGCRLSSYPLCSHFFFFFFLPFGISTVFAARESFGNPR